METNNLSFNKILPCHTATKMSEVTSKQGHCLGRRGAIKFPSPFDLTYVDFYLWGNTKDDVCCRNPTAFPELIQEIENTCAEIPLDN